MKRPWLCGEKNPACRPEVRAKISSALKGRPSPKSEQWRVKNKKVIQTLAKLKRATRWRNVKLSEINRHKVGARNPFYGKHHSSQSIQKMLATKSANGDFARLAELNRDSDFQRRRLRACLKRPNKQELALIQLLDAQFPNQWKYVGNGEVILGTKCPDFINIDGQKKIIELYGTYWHRESNSEERITYFRRYGFDTLIIWESELKDKAAIVQKVARFTRAE